VNVAGVRMISERKKLRHRKHAVSLNLRAGGVTADCWQHM